VRPPLACSVRGCGLPLERRDRDVACAAGHTFDLARRGYINLLQPQDRRSASAGDAPEAVDARARLLDAGIGRASLEGTLSRAATLGFSGEAWAVDLGCGHGDALAMLEQLVPVFGIGIDLSTAAIERAARRHPGTTWVVANADRRLPLLDERVALVLSLNGRRNPGEAARVLAPGGHLLMTVPAPDDLIELRQAVQGQAVARSRGEALIAEHQPSFELVEHWTSRERIRVEREHLVDLLHGTYRGRRQSLAAPMEQLAGMEVTLAAEAFLFARKSAII
jgi:23S rRNA (guanine745-N1)-methyltransferase